MATLIDTSLWIDFTRAKSPRILKQFISPHILDPDVHLAEPVAFEVLRHATPREVQQITQQFQTLPLLPTPSDLWAKAAELGRDCRARNFTAGSADLLIAAIAIHHHAEILTFDQDFRKIANVSALRVKVLQRP